MRTVRIIKSWNEPDLFRQTPGGLGVWADTRFTDEPVTECDYVLVLNYSSAAESVYAPKGNVWSVQQEPPNEVFRFWHRAHPFYRRVFTQDVSLRGERYVLSQPALPWHVDHDYNFLSRAGIPEKTRSLSWITSNVGYFNGHRQRLGFLERIRGKVDFDLFGRGFSPIANKWDGLAPYRYSLAIENFSGPYYWTEKITDCFLSWTMPIYYGCSNIGEFFPEESFIRIDIGAADVAEQIKNVVQSDLWLIRKEAVAFARELVLNKYQFFPYFVNQIRSWEKRPGFQKPVREKIMVPAEKKSHRQPLSLQQKISARMQTAIRKPAAGLKTLKYFLFRTFYRTLRIPGFCRPKDLRFLYELVLHSQAGKCLEIGTYLGRSAYVICAALRKKSGRDNRLVCVDMFDYPVSRHWHDESIRKMAGYPFILGPYLEPSAGVVTMRDALNRTMERYPFMKKFVEARTSDSRSLDLGTERFDFVFIDGDHSYEGVKKDFETVFPRLKSGAIVCFHDNYPDFPGIQKFIAELRQKPKLMFLGQKGVTVAFRAAYD